MSPAALITIAKVREESKCLAMDEWTDRAWCTQRNRTQLSQSGVWTAVPCRDPGGRRRGAGLQREAATLPREVPLRHEAGGTVLSTEGRWRLARCGAHWHTCVSSSPKLTGCGSQLIPSCTSVGGLLMREAKRASTQKGQGVPRPSCGAEAATVESASSGVTLVPKRQPSRSPTGARVYAQSLPAPCPREMPEKSTPFTLRGRGAGAGRVETDVSDQGRALRQD